MKSFDFKGKKVLIRVDFNVPQDENLAVTDNTRILAAAPTIKKVLASGGIPVLMSHLGRPNGVREPKMSLRALVGEVEKAVGATVHFSEDCFGEAAASVIAKAKPG